MCLIPSGAKHAYLERKGVGAQEVKIENGNVVVPARDIHGKLWTLQTIPAKEGGKKLFVKHGQKNACFHLLGTAQSRQVWTSCSPRATRRARHCARRLAFRSSWRSTPATCCRSLGVRQGFPVKHARAHRIRPRRCRCD